jgi:ADP-ribose pyrophosphatase
MNWKTLSSTYISQHKYFTARRDVCQRPDGVIVDPYFVVEMPPSVVALPITADNQVLLVKQFRHPVNKIIIELPGGFVDEGEDLNKAVARELLEETGYSFTQFTSLGKIAANPGCLNNFTHLYLATGGVKTATQQLDHNEEIELFTIPITELHRMMQHNEIEQALHLSCIYYGLQKLQQ